MLLIAPFHCMEQSTQQRKVRYISNIASIKVKSSLRRQVCNFLQLSMHSDLLWILDTARAFACLRLSYGRSVQLDSSQDRIQAACRIAG